MAKLPNPFKTVKVASVEDGVSYTVLKGKIKNKVELLTLIGALIEVRTQSAFETGGRPGNKWQDRAVPNIPGILRDLDKGGADSVKRRRFVPRPVLVDTGRLSGSYVAAPARKDEVVIGSNVPYANLHHKGGKSSIQVSKGTLKKLIQFTSSSSKGKEHSLKLIAAANKIKKDGGKFKVRVPKRPALVIIDQDLRDITTLVKENVVRDVKRGKSTPVFILRKKPRL